MQLDSGRDFLKTGGKILSTHELNTCMYGEIIIKYN